MIIRSISAIPILLALLMIQSQVDSNVTPNHTTLAGFVIDEKTRQPIQWANAQISGTPLGAVTLENGSFMISDVPPGDHKLVVMMMRYEPAKQVVRAEADSITVVVIELRRDRGHKKPRSN